jgi:hypothetical protein
MAGPSDTLLDPLDTPSKWFCSHFSSVLTIPHNILKFAFNFPRDVVSSTLNIPADVTTFVFYLFLCLFCSGLSLLCKEQGITVLGLLVFYQLSLLAPSAAGTKVTESWETPKYQELLQTLKKI